MNKTFAVFANGGTMTTAQTALWQYDYGQILVIQGVQLPTSYEVQFCNTGDSTTITSIGDASGVVIPDQFLQSGETIYAYIYLHTGNADGETEYKITIPVLNRAEPTDIEPTPAQESTIGQLIDALNAGVSAAEAAASHAPIIQNDYWYVWDSTAGEYVSTNVKAEGVDGTNGTDGADGVQFWWTTGKISTPGGNLAAVIDYFTGGTGSPKIGDYLFGNPPGQAPSEDNITYLYSITNIIGSVAALAAVSSLKGADGVGVPAGGTTGQVLKKASGADYDTEWADESGGGGGTSDYSDLTNKPQINSVTLSGNKSLADLGIAAASDIPTVPSAYTSTPADLGTASAGSSTKWAKGDHVHKMPSASDVGAYALPSGGIPKTDLASAVQTSLGKADTALQSAPVTSVNNQTGAVSLSIPSTASDVGAIAAPSSPSVGDFLVYTANGWAAQSLSVWQGGNYGS